MIGTTSDRNDSRWVRLALTACLAAIGSMPTRADYEAARQALARNDYEQARRDARQAAEGGDAPAQHLLGQLLIEGKGGKKDEVEALAWFQRAAEQGDEWAQFSLGNAHYFGRGTPADPVAGARWLDLAAAQGHVVAQFNRGVLARDGQGVPRDAVAAAMWFMLAAPSEKNAASSLRALAPRLSADERERARRLAADWKRRPDGPAVRAVAAAPPLDDWLATRRAHSTALERHARAPSRVQELGPTPHGAQAVEYASGGRTLKAWLVLPEGRSPGQRVPAVVYFHGGFGLDESDLRNARAFADRGIAVLLPTLRAENGNPGEFELFYGEVDDGAAAVRWLAARPEIDAERVHTFGHSAGGAISALLSLWDDLPLRSGASAGGLYGPDAFDEWRRAGRVPFDTHDVRELRLRLLVGHTRFMRRPHLTYVGEADSGLQPIAEAAAAESRERGGKLEMRVMPGDHGSSLRPSIADFALRIGAGR